jgi:hypothetical protein
MNCLTCTSSRGLSIGSRVSPSEWEQVWMGRDLAGTIVDLGQPGTLRMNTAKVKWDCGHKDQWWPLNCLHALAPTSPAATQAKPSGGAR